MKRSAPTRRTPLPKPTKRIRTRKVDPQKRRWAKHRCKPFTDWLKTEPCCVTGWRVGDWVPSHLTALHIAKAGYWYDATLYRAVVDPAHDIPRSLGGDDLDNALPLVRQLHDEQHAIGWPRFEKKYGIDRHAIAKDCTERWLATAEGQAWQEHHSA